jgi:LuxR family maltose regulon positive regulatory protein
LRLIAQGMTNQEVADELVISVGTVKWYTSQIYGKLDVGNRTEAAARARDLGLLAA